MNSLYIHVPFCIRKCYYCDFISYPFETGEAEGYLRGLSREARLYGELFPPEQKKLQTVFVGGGTPTCLDETALASLLETCLNNFQLAPGAEVTVEANPGTLTPGKLKILRDYGVNRLSIGVQSFQDALLAGIGRIHRVQDVYNSVEIARSAGFENLNLDLIYALPGQSLSDWKESLRQAVNLQPEHLAVYSLKIEEGTPFGCQYEEGKLKPLDEDTELKMYREAIDYLSSKGYEHYEISNFARPGYQSRHNLTYWNNEEYLGLGPGAWSFIDHKRYANHRDLHIYHQKLVQGKLPVAEEEVLGRKVEMSETVFMALRKMEGLDLDYFSLRFNKRLEEVFEASITKLVNLKMIEIVNNKLRLTDRGIPVANEIFAHFLL